MKYKCGRTDWTFITKENKSHCVPKQMWHGPYVWTGTMTEIGDYSHCLGLKHVQPASRCTFCYFPLFAPTVDST